MKSGKLWTAVFCGALLCCVGGAKASTYIVTMQEVGAGVVATGSGQIDLTGLTAIGTIGSSAGIRPVNADVVLGTPGLADGYSGVSGPTNFGSGGIAFASTTSGPRVASLPLFGALLVPLGYVSDTALGASTITFSTATLASLGVTPGTYVWTWGQGAVQRFELDVVTSTPLPAALPLFATGLGALGLFGWRRKKKAAALAA